MNSEDRAMPDAWEFARSQGKSLLETAPKDFRMQWLGETMSLQCTMTTRQEMEAVRAIIYHLGQPWLPNAQVIEAASAGETGTGSTEGESPIAESDAPNKDTPNDH